MVICVFSFAYDASLLILFHLVKGLNLYFFPLNLIFCKHFSMFYCTLRIFWSQICHLRIINYSLMSGNLVSQISLIINTSAYLTGLFWEPWENTKKILNTKWLWRWYSGRWPKLGTLLITAIIVHSFSKNPHTKKAEIEALVHFIK